MENARLCRLFRQVLVVALVFTAFSVIANSALADSTVVFMVEDTLYPQIESEVTTYRNDLEAEGYTTQINLVTSGANTPEDIRTFLQGVPNIVGAYFVGDIAVAYYEHDNDWSGYASFPCDLYYMDIDGYWDDTDSDSKFDVHEHGGGNMAPDIWVGRLKTSNLDKIGTEVNILKAFFGKAHDFRQGSLTRSKSALLYVDDDWVSFSNSAKNGLVAIYGDPNVTYVTDQATTTAADYESRLPQDREFIHICAHSTSSYHQFYGGSGGSTTNSEIVSINPPSLFNSLYCCSAARLTSSNCLAACYTFRLNSGLAAQGSSKTGSLTMGGLGTFFSYMGQGHSFGDAFLLYGASSLNNNSSYTIKWMYGLILFGDPSVGPKTGIVMPSAKLTLQDSTTGDEVYTNSTTVDTVIEYDHSAVAWLLGETQSTQPEVDDPNWVGVKPATYELSPGDGFKSVYIWVKNSNAQINEDVTYDRIFLDTQPPVTTADPAGGTYANQVTVTLTATDTSGVSAIYYTVDGSDPDTLSLVYSGPIVIATDTVLKFFAVDGAGNVEAINTENYLFDGSLIEITVDTNPSGLTITVDGTEYTAPQPFAWEEASSHTIGTTSPQSGGPDTQYVFDSWSDAGAQEHTIIVPSSAIIYTADFKTQHKLTMSVSPVGSGTVTPSGITWHDAGTAVNLSASPNAGYEFVMWFGGPVADPNNPDTTVTMNSPKWVTASFAGEVSVTVTSFPAGRTVTVDTVDYAAPRTFSWPEGSSHTIGVSSPQSGGLDTQYVFDSWSDGGAQEHTITVPSASITYTANFKTQYTLTASVNPVGSGTVTPSGTTWQDAGTSVNLSASASVGYTFVNWTGDTVGDPNNPDTTITMDSGKTVTAVFTEIEYTLTVNLTGNGAVTKAPDQPTYHYGDEVTLTATPDAGWTFDCWEDDLTGTDNPATITMDGNKTVTAVFVPIEYTLVVNLTANGAVTKAPDQLTYHYGDEVTLTATPDAGWTLDHWEDDLSGTDNPATITMDGNKTVTAVFTEIEYTLTVNLTGNGAVTKAPDQPTYHYGDEVTLTATPDAGWTFDCWEGNLTGTDNPATITMDGNKTVTAVFTRLYIPLPKKSRGCSMGNFDNTDPADVLGCLLPLLLLMLYIASIRRRQSCCCGSITSQAKFMQEITVLGVRK